MNKNKFILTIILICACCIGIIGISANCNAQDISYIMSKTEDAGISNVHNSNVISAYDVNEDVCIDIDNLSIEGAVDNNFDNCTNDSIYNDSQITGNITQVTTVDNYQANNNSQIYYVGDTSDVGMIDDEGQQVLSTATDAMPTNIEVDNWEEISGDLKIKVNKKASCVTIYKGETPIKAMVCSAGESTPEGTFYMQSQWEWLGLIEGQYGRYCSQISGDYLFHSVPYNSMDIYDLDTGMYNQLGTLCSHGCIRLTIEDAKWIYDNCTTGTEIVIYNDDNPGPLGKPSIARIPLDQTWDPTDLDIQ